MLQKSISKSFAAEFRLADVCQDDLGRVEFDVALCFQSFPHFRDPAAALRNLARYLKSHCSLIVMHLRGSEGVNAFYRAVGGVIAPIFFRRIINGSGWIAATNKDLNKLVHKGVFRENLFYRIHVIRLALPSLRDRREEIPLLIEHFVAKFNRLQGKDVVGVSDEVLARLMEHDYPGNVCELENIIEHAFVLCRSALKSFLTCLCKFAGLGQQLLRTSRA